MYGTCSTHGNDNKGVRDYDGNMKGRDHSEDLGVDGRIILKCILGSRVMWLRIGSSGGLL
jgi:hypothetical protein